MTLVVMNPGSGPVGRANVRSAVANMRVFAQDVVDLAARSKVKVKARVVRRPEHDEGGGRFDFDLYLTRSDRKRARLVTVSMPGWPIARVRFTGAPTQDVWGFPRLFVDGNSWLWKYAVSQARFQVVPFTSDLPGMDP